MTSTESAPALAEETVAAISEAATTAHAEQPTFRLHDWTD